MLPEAALVREIGGRGRDLLTRVGVTVGLGGLVLWIRAERMELQVATLSPFWERVDA